LSFRFIIELDGNELHTVRILKTFLNIGCFPVALLWRGSKSGKVSVGYPDTLPAWLRTVVSNRAPDLVSDAVRDLIRDSNEDSENWC
jgi:hypothetical protein